MEDILQLFNPWWSEEYEPPGIIRDRYLDRISSALDDNKIALLYGPRRSGKTTIMRQFIASRLGALEGSRLLYASMDHPDIEHVPITRLLKEFRRMKGIRAREPHILCLDEVQHRKGFEKEIKALFDIEDGLRIVISGSSSLIIRHRTPSLTGRYRPIHVGPLNFNEFLKFMDYEYEEGEPQLMENRMEEYLKVGGMPEYVLKRNTDDILHTVDDIIFKDIAPEYQIRDPSVIKNLYYLLMHRVGKPLSYSRIGRVLEISPDTARRYIGYLRETFLVHLVERYGTPNERKYSNKKCYAPDNGIRVIAGGNVEMGPLAENLLFLLFSRKDMVYYYQKNGREVDFIYGNTAIECKYRSEIDEKDLDGLRGLRIKKVTNRLMVTRRSISKDIDHISLWKLAHDPSRLTNIEVRPY